MNITVLCSIWHFRDWADAVEEYEYDENGNMTKDLNSNISLVEYNFLNLPSKIEFMDGSTTWYTYDAMGRKLRAEYLKVGTQDTLRTDYCGNLIYEQGRPKMLLVDGGYVTFNDNASDSLSFGEGWGGASYHYYLKDHLGNNRVVVGENDSIEQVNHYYPYGGLMAESTGGDTQRYKYNGKELDRMHGLDWYDYGARWMNGLTFMTQDRFAEKYYETSPYVYCQGNPMKYTDINGDSIVVLEAPYGASHLGHMAALIQNENQTWSLWSKNGTESNFELFGPEGEVGTDQHNNRGGNKDGTPKEYDSIDDFFNDEKANPLDKNGVPEYTIGYLIPTNMEQDARARAGAKLEIEKDYNVFTSNCAQTVQSALKGAGLNPGNGILPRQTVFPSIIRGNPGGILIKYYDIANKQFYKVGKYGR